MTGSTVGIALKLECPVCIETLVAPVYQCHNGHLICESCIRRVDHCPQCRAAYPEEKIRNLAIEEIIAGQAAPPTQSSVDASCLDRPIQLCKDLGIQCDEGVARGHFVDHLVSRHGSLGSDMVSTQASQSFEGQVYEAISSGTAEWEPHYFITEDDSTFCLLLQTKLAERKMHWRVYAIMYDTSDSAPPTIKINLLTEQDEASPEYAVPAISWKGQATALGLRDRGEQPPCFTLAVEQILGLPSWRIRVKLCSRPGMAAGLSSTVVSRILATGGSEKHPHVACDGCDSCPVAGIRFKCATCNNYDLCERCCLDEGIHRHHVFIALPTQKIGSKVGGLLRRLHTRGSGCYGYNGSFICNGCYNSISGGPHFHCTDCYNYDLCERCYLKKRYHGHHLFVLALTEGDIDSKLKEVIKSFRDRRLIEQLRKSSSPGASDLYA